MALIAAPPISRATELVEFALEALPPMRLDDGCFCFERRLGHSAPIGRSPRYTLMVELGLLRAQSAGYELPVVPEELGLLSWRELEAGSLSPGDIGLMLWVDARANRGRGDELVRHLRNRLAGDGGLGSLLGMELGWIIAGLAHQVTASGGSGGEELLREALNQLLVTNRASSGLVRHFGAPGWRRRFPNFATQIYSVLALAMVARAGLDDRALPAACALADRLIEFQLHDGGWPWLFDAERGAVIEQYEIYSVHQDAMAPMALLELWHAGGDGRYVAAADKGLSWIYGQNELGVDMVRRQDGLVLRSIRRRRGVDRLRQGAVTGASLLGLQPGGSPGRLVEVNPTDRPYHFGWVLEAWCGRLDALDRSRS